MTAVAQAGGAVGALGLLVIVLGTRRWQRVLGFGGWAAGMAALAVYLAPHGHRGLLAGAAVVGLLVAACGAALLVHVPWLLPFAALAAVPARFHVEIGDADAHLLLPLYGVVAAAALALFWELPTDERRPRELGVLALPLGLWVGWSGLSVLWTDDPRRAAIELACFVLPFGLLAVCVSRLPWSRRGVAWLCAQLGVMGVAFALVGVWQWLTRDSVWTPGALSAGSTVPAVRVDSVFADPRVYGRFLVVAILALLVVVLARPASRVGAAAAAAVAVTWAGLYYSYSQASLAALGVGALAAGALLWRRRAALAFVAAAAVALAVAAALPSTRDDVRDHARSGWESAGGRTALVRDDLRVAADHPLGGVGLAAYEPRPAPAAPSRAAPVTVAAETGVPGLLLLAWLLAEALLLAFRRAGSSFPGRASAAFGIMVAAIAVHSLFDNVLFEDPVLWGVLGLAAVASRARPQRAVG